MIDRGFINTNTNYFNNELNNELNNESNNESNTITESSLFEIVDIGLGIENLSLYSTKNPIKEDSYCVICMNTHKKGTQFYLMKCMHSFCEDCSKRWFDFKSVCPLCKTNMKNI